MSTVVTPAQEFDLDGVIRLMIEMDEFYGEVNRESVQTKADHIAATIFGDPPSAHLLVARDEQHGSIVGIAAYSYLWPATGTTRSLYLKELYVQKDRRRERIAHALMNQLFTIAREVECSRVEWTTDHGNEEAQRFYSSLGAEPDGRKLFYRQEI